MKHKKIVEQKHITNTYNPDKPFKCEHCQKQFATKGSLTKHMLYHSKDMPFRCENCNKGFHIKQGLDRHMMTHTREKPFKCNHCSHSFIQKSDLVNHLRVHTGERPFSCSKCDKSFKRKFDCKKHELQCIDFLSHRQKLTKSSSDATEDMEYIEVGDDETEEKYCIVDDKDPISNKEKNDAEGFEDNSKQIELHNEVHFEVVKPLYSYSQLIVQAINQKEEKELDLAGICQFLSILINRY